MAAFCWNITPRHWAINYVSNKCNTSISTVSELETIQNERNTFLRGVGSRTPSDAALFTLMMEMQLVYETLHLKNPLTRLFVRETFTEFCRS